MSNTLGTLYRLTCFGESHGPAIGGVIDGCPAGIELDLDHIQQELDRRRPGQSNITTQRKEPDHVVILSGVTDGRTTGAPIGFTIENRNQKSQDYDHLKDVYRPSHADFTYDKKYGHRDHAGGGRSSARATAAWVVGGAIAKQVMRAAGIEANAWVSAVGDIKLELDPMDVDPAVSETNVVRCPDAAVAEQMEAYIKEVRKDGDTIGGVVTGRITGVPVGLGEPLFNKLSAAIGHAMLSINAVKGFEMGSGFAGTSMRGSAHNDIIRPDGSTETNWSGGIQGGISNGQPIYFNVAFKPVATIMKDQPSIDSSGNSVTVEGKGRHDPCVVPRAVAIVESMAAMVMLDHLMLHKSTRA